MSKQLTAVNNYESIPLIFIIGLQGSGKSTASKLIADEFKGLFYEGDDAIPCNSEIKNRIANGLTVSPDQINEFIRNDFVREVKIHYQKAMLNHMCLVVSQALFFNVHRQLLQEIFKNKVYFIVLNATRELQEKQIVVRGLNNAKSESEIFQEIKSVRISNPYFEAPDNLLNVFQINYLGSGYEETFLTEIRKFIVL